MKKNHSDTTLFIKNAIIVIKVILPTIVSVIVYVLDISVYYSCSTYVS